MLQSWRGTVNLIGNGLLLLLQQSTAVRPLDAAAIGITVEEMFADPETSTLRLYRTRLKRGQAQPVATIMRRT
jgi:hypothetical protein